MYLQIWYIPIKMKAQLKEASLFKKIVDVVKDLVHDVNFVCTDEGIQLQAMDTAHVTLITMTLLADGFTSYECEDTMYLGINIGILSKILKCAENTDILTLEAEPEGDTLSIKVQSQSANRDCTFELQRINIETDMTDVPDFEYACSVHMPSSQFKKVIADLASLGETCSVEIHTSDIQFGVISELNKANFVLHEDTTSKDEKDHITINNSSKETMKHMFALRYLSYFAKTSAITETVGIFMKAGFPLFVNYDLGELGSLGYYLAPKLED